MKSLNICALALTVALSVVAAQAQLVAVEDFEAYTADTSIHMQGDDGGIPRWYVQGNTDFILVDHGNSNVRDVAGNQVLELVNRDTDGGIDTTTTAMAVYMHRITGQGTVYLQFLADGPNDTLLCTNDLWAGFGDYTDPSLGTLAGYQIPGAGYSSQANLVRLSGDEEFRARDNSVYTNVAAGLTSAVWQEMWIQFDADNDQCKYFVAVNGGDIQQVMSGSGEFWGYRDDSNNGVENLLWQVGGYPWPAMDTETTVLIDNIYIDAGAWTTDRPAPLPPVNGGDPVCIPGDADCDGDVDLDDFVALKVGFGSGTTWAEGDFDEDGDVDLDDFVILKTNFGATAN